MVNADDLAYLVKLATDNAFGCDSRVVVAREAEQSFSLQVRTGGDSDLIFSVDANRLKFNSNKVSSVNINEVSVISQSVVVTLVDKLKVTTERTVLRRTKDLIDLYAMLRTDLKLNLFDIIEELMDRNITLGDCYQLRNYTEGDKQSLQYAYSKQKSTPVQEPLSEIISVVLRFIGSIHTDNTTNKIWNHTSLEWEE